MTTKDRDFDAEINRRYERLKKDLDIHVGHWEKFSLQQNFFISVLKRPIHRKLTKDTYIDSTVDSLLLKRLKLSPRYGVKSIAEVKSFYIDYIKNPLTAQKAEVIAKYLVIIDQLREYQKKLNAIARDILKRVGEEQAIVIDQGKVAIAHALNVELARLETLLKDDNDFSALDKDGHKLAIGDMLEFAGVISLAPTVHDVARAILRLISYLVSHSAKKRRYDEVLFDMSHAAKHSERTPTSLPPLVHASVLPVTRNGDRYDSASQYYESSFSDSRVSSKAPSGEGSKTAGSKRKGGSSARSSKEVDYGVGRPGNSLNNTENNHLPTAEVRARRMAATIRKRESASAKNSSKPQDVTLLPPIHEHGVLGNSTHEADNRQAKNRQDRGRTAQPVISDDDDDGENDDAKSEAARAASDVIGLSLADSSTIQASVIEDLQRRVRSLEESSESMKTRQKLQFLLSQGLPAIVTPETMRVIKDHVGPNDMMAFGLAMGLTIGDIASLKESHHKNNKEQVLQLMLTWQRRQGQGEATLEKIVDALVQTGQRELANACLDDLKLLVVEKKDREH